MSAWCWCDRVVFPKNFEAFQRRLRIVFRNQAIPLKVPFESRLGFFFAKNKRHKILIYLTSTYNACAKQFNELKEANVLLCTSRMLVYVVKEGKRSLI
jgi:hypothetical protein